MSVEVLVPFHAFRSGSFVGDRSSAFRASRGFTNRMQNLRRSSLSDGGASASRGLPGTPKNQRRLSVRGGTLKGNERARARAMFVMVWATMGEN